jgi:hypothetical protein
VRSSALALAALALTLTGCETTAEKSAKLERAAKEKVSASGQSANLGQHGLSITRLSTKVRVIGTTILHSSEGDAAVITLRNVSDEALQDVPIAITAKTGSGRTVYTNAAPGLARGLVSVPLIPSHGTLSWIDDQVQASATPTSVIAKIGEGTPTTGAIPRLSVADVHLSEDATSGAGAEGNVVNRSSVTQQELIVYAVARRGGKILAAGRAVLPQAPAGASTRFQLYFIGSPTGGKLELSAPPSTLR